MESLLAKAQEVEPQAAFTGVTVRAGANSPVALAAGQRTLYVDPYDGRILGETSPGVRRFFRVGHRLASHARAQRRAAHHRQSDHRRLQPRVPLHRRQRHLPLVAEELDAPIQLRSVTLFNWDLRGKARDFNWHNTIGFWSAIPLFFVVLGATRDLVSVGERSGVSGGRRGAAPTAAAAGGGAGTAGRSRRART